MRYQNMFSNCFYSINNINLFTNQPPTALSLSSTYFLAKCKPPPTPCFWKTVNQPLTRVKGVETMFANPTQTLYRLKVGKFAVKY